MKKILSFGLLALFMAACAGNPPAWWNPQNRYGSADETVTQQTPKKQALPITDEDMDPLPDTAYEEITLTPMSDEEGENASGAAAGQNNTLTPDEKLPAPSVLD